MPPVTVRGLMPSVSRLCISAHHQIVQSTSYASKPWLTSDPDLIIKDRPHSHVKSTTDPSSEQPKYWEDPWRYAFGDPPPPPKFTKVIESKSEFEHVRRLLPLKSVPQPPKHDHYPTPSGWIPPRTPDPSIPFFVRRDRYHSFPLYLETRRDLLDPKTLDYTYIEIIKMKYVEGDVTACANHLREFLRDRLGHDVAINVVETHGRISVKGADRTDLEAFLIKYGF